MAGNVGMLDRWIRIVVGLALLSLVYVGPKTAWGWLGAIPVLTALVGACPVYGVFGWSTCKSSKAPNDKPKEA